MKDQANKKVAAETLKIRDKAEKQKEALRFAEKYEDDKRKDDLEKLKREVEQKKLDE